MRCACCLCVCSICRCCCGACPSVLCVYPLCALCSAYALCALRAPHRDSNAHRRTSPAYPAAAGQLRTCAARMRQQHAECRCAGVQVRFVPPGCAVASAIPHSPPACCRPAQEGSAGGQRGRAARTVGRGRGYAVYGSDSSAPGGIASGARAGAVAAAALAAPGGGAGLTAIRTASPSAGSSTAQHRHLRTEWSKHTPVSRDDST